MKRYTLSFGASIDHKPEHPDRTAKRYPVNALNGDVYYQVWPSRAAMLITVRMQKSGPDFARAWRPVQR